ncbi:unnamed protein product [Calicophoron daubneyi]|uniref:Solute carrier family 15 member 1 n=1 Tax=Calicophoron daubneyi TaxID=300641 RepID=A0AAV2TZ28_CALDB
MNPAKFCEQKSKSGTELSTIAEFEPLEKETNLKRDDEDSKELLLQNGKKNEKSSQILHESHRVSNTYRSLLSIPGPAYVVVIYLLFEKMAFLGIQSILPLFLTVCMGFHETAGRVVYHCFSAVSCLLPLVGGMMADNSLGRFKTIIVFLTILTVSNLATLLCAVIKFWAWFVLIAVFVIYVGSGGAKACLSAFGADQLSKRGSEGMEEEPSEEQVVRYFSVIYFAVNLGALAGQILMPSLRGYTLTGQATALDKSDYGYPLAFGTASSIYLVIIVLFLSFSRFFTKKSPEGAIISKYFRYFLRILRRRSSCVKKSIPRAPFPGPAVHRDHEGKYLEQENEEFSPTFVQQFRQTLSVTTLFLPLPVFWALYEQQGSTWVFQANRMDGTIWRDWEIKPEQMLIVNEIICMLGIPVMNTLIYPLLARVHLLKKLTSRMIFGYLLASSSFLCSSVIELLIAKRTYGSLALATSKGSMFVHNQVVDCPLSVDVYDALSNRTVYAGSIDFGHSTPKLTISPQQLQVSVRTDKRCNTTAWNRRYQRNSFSVSVPISPKKLTVLVCRLSPNKNKTHKLLHIDRIHFDPRTISGNLAKLLMVDLREEAILQTKVEFRLPDTAARIYSLANSSSFLSLGAGTYSVNLFHSSRREPSIGSQNITLGLASASMLFLRNAEALKRGEDTCRECITVSNLTIHQAKPVRLLAQIPQIFLMTFAEICISISAISFAYANAPQGMKTVIHALNQFTMFAGNFVVIICTLIMQYMKSEFSEQITYGLLSALCAGATAWLSAQYDKHKSTDFVEPKEMEDWERKLPTRTARAYSDLTSVQEFFPLPEDYEYIRPRMHSLCVRSSSDPNRVPALAANSLVSTVA